MDSSNKDLIIDSNPLSVLETSAKLATLYYLFYSNI